MKKSPLIMPPDYKELPLPKTENEQGNNSGEEIVKSLIINRAIMLKAMKNKIPPLMNLKKIF